MDFTPAGNKPCFEPAGARDYCAPLAYRPVPDRLLRNRGDGTFEDVSEKAGITRAFGNGLGVAVGDYDADGWPDIYVANDATPNQLWMNRHDGTFEDMGLLSGTAYNAAGRPEGSMGIASGDYDRDGDEDLVVTNLVGETFVLYENDGTGGFEDRRAAVGLAAPTAMMTGFGADWFDADNDGWLELFIANGAVNLIPALRGTPNPFRQRNQLFTTGPATGYREPGTGRPARRARPAACAPEPRRRREPADAAAARGATHRGDDASGPGPRTARGWSRCGIRRSRPRWPRRHRRHQQRRPGPPAAQRDQRRRSLGATALDAADDEQARARRHRCASTLPGQPPIVRRVRSGGSYLSSSDERLHVGLGRRHRPRRRPP